MLCANVVVFVLIVRRCSAFQSTANSQFFSTPLPDTFTRKGSRLRGVSEYTETKDEPSSMMMSRSVEIASIVFELLVPLVSSGLTEVLDNEKETSWEKFWAKECSAQIEKSSSKISNADRVTMAIEKLGPTYVKFGQAVASRPDIIPLPLAQSLSTLQDDMDAFDSDTAKQIIYQELSLAKVNENKVNELLASLSVEPVAAASIGQVYKGKINGMDVAVKVQRPGIRDLVQKDAALLKTLATVAEAIPTPASIFSSKDDSISDTSRLINTELVSATDEFMSRVFEEMDYRNEARNAKKFANLYSNKYGSVRHALPGGGVIVPEIFDDMCTENVLVMEWIEGSKLTSLSEEVDQNEVKENLSLIKQALYCTLSQLLEFGCMHADPHGGNLLKVTSSTSSSSTLAYLDFGILATIPSTVRDGLVCAVAQLVFAKDVEAVASLFGELDLLESEVVDDPKERAALTKALTQTMQEVLVYPAGESISLSKTSTAGGKDNTNIPELKFDKLLDGLVRLVPRFKFQLPPYFINNARALGTLEGIARSLDPEFNAFSLMYPYALNRILENPSGSPVVEATLQNMVRSSETGKIDRGKVARLLRDSALYTGFSKRKVLVDILKTDGGKKLAGEVVLQEVKHIGRLRWLFRRGRKKRKNSSTYLQL